MNTVEYNEFIKKKIEEKMIEKQQEKKLIKSIFIKTGNCDDLIKTHKRLHEEKKNIKAEDLPF